MNSEIVQQLRIYRKNHNYWSEIEAMTMLLLSILIHAMMQQFNVAEGQYSSELIWNFVYFSSLLHLRISFFFFFFIEIRSIYKIFSLDSLARRTNEYRLTGFINLVQMVNETQTILVWREFSEFNIEQTRERVELNHILTWMQTLEIDATQKKKTISLILF